MRERLVDDEADILQKADALLSKRRPASTVDFPVLTEVVQPPASARRIATSTETEHAANGLDSGMPRLNLNQLEDRVLARALNSSNAIVSNWSATSLRTELMFMINSSIDKLEQDITTILNEKVSAHVRASVRNALELELIEIRNSRIPDKPT